MIIFFFFLPNSHYFVKDNKIEAIILKSPSEGDLDLVYLNKNNINKFRGQVAIFCVNTSLDVWHARLGHP